MCSEAVVTGVWAFNLGCNRLVMVVVHSLGSTTSLAQKTWPKSSRTADVWSTARSFGVLNGSISFLRRQSVLPGQCRDGLASSQIVIFGHRAKFMNKQFSLAVTVDLVGTNFC